MTNPSRALLGQMARTAHESPEGERALLLVLFDTETIPAAWPACDVYLESGSLEHGCADYFGPGGIVRIGFDGTVECFPN